MIVIPENNSIRMIKRQYNQPLTGSTFTESEAPFNRQYFNTRYEDEINMNLDSRIRLYGQLYADMQNYIIQEYRGEAITWQFLSDAAFPLVLDDTIRIRAILPDGSVTLTAENLQLKILNTDYQIKYTYVKFINVGGKVAFYFESGNQKEFDYNGNVIESKDFHLNKKLPEFFAVGQSYVFLVSGSVDGNSHSGTYTSIEYNETVNAWVAVTNHTYNTTSNTQGTLTTRYERSTLNVYELTVSSFKDVNCLYFEIATSSDTFTTIDELWESDYIHLNLDIKDAAMLFQWQHAKDKFLIDFRTGLLNYCYLPVTMYEIKPDGEVTIYNNEVGGGSLLDSEYKRNYVIRFTGLPRHLIEKIALIIRHDTLYINGKEFVYNGDSFSSEQLEETMLYNCSFDVFEPELLGIYSTNYINTTRADTQFKLLIDTADNELLIDDNGNSLRIQ